MTPTVAAPATYPPADLPGLDPAWSRLVSTPQLDGSGRTWHVLDNVVADPEVTVLCVHGNPTWSYLWRDTLATAGPRVRVIAVDQLDMGYSERTGTVRRLAQRIADLEALTDELDIKSPVVTIAHDWGGPISLGWAARNRDQLAGIVLTNTAVIQPADAAAPLLIRAARLPGVLERICVDTSSFIRGALALDRPAVARPVREAYLAPFRTADRRFAIGEFVRDIPLEPDHPSYETAQWVAESLAGLNDVPVLLLWGPSDPVFSDRYLHDLETRLPHADVHRFVGASHLLPEQADVASAVHTWIGQLGDSTPPRPPAGQRPPLWSAIDQRAEDDQVAVIEMSPDGVRGSLTFRGLADDVRQVAAGLAGCGVTKGDRVALLIPPGLDLSVCLYACWRIGAVVVVADAGLGLRGLGRALRSADPDYLIGIPKALAAARALGWPGRRISAVPLAAAAARALGAQTSLEELRELGTNAETPPTPGPNDLAAVAFTSGATGPAKGVAYRHGQLQAQRDVLMTTYDIRPSDRLVAAFAPFALYGPAMGIPSVVPAMEVTSPGTLDAAALGAAARAIGASLVFASPAALANVLATSGGLGERAANALAQVRLLLSAGAPVPAATLRSLRRLMPEAEFHTPYGMTEVLPVADISLTEIDAAGDQGGVCVGLPLPGVEVTIGPLDELGRATGPLTTEPSVVGEVCVRAAHMKDTYDRLWVTQRASAEPPGWHRSGDVGRYDEKGRLWIEGRLVHTIATAHGVVTPVPVEQRIRSIPGIVAAAAVGVGPIGTQQVVAVVVTDDPRRRPALAGESLSDGVRSAFDVDIAAVLIVPALPVDKRHNSKIDRTRLAKWAARVLSGGRMVRP